MRGQDNLRPDERRVVRIDPDTGLVTDKIEHNGLLVPFVGLAELLSDLRHRRAGTAELVLLVALMILVARGSG